MEDLSISDIQSLMEGFSLEVTPRAYQNSKIDLRDYIPRQTKIFITDLKNTQANDTLLVAQRVMDSGFVPVPHIAARNFMEESKIFELLEKYQKIGVKDILLIAGGAEQPTGEVKDALQLLDSDYWIKCTFNSIAFAGHPEGHPLISDEEIWQSLEKKQLFSNKIQGKALLVTQFGFLAAPMVDWVENLRERDMHFPVKIGIPGLATPTTLLKHAQACGVGASVSFLKNNRQILPKLVSLSTPDLMIADLSRERKKGRLKQLSGLHFYPLGGLEKTVKWLAAVSEGNIEFNKGGGFDVTS